MRSQYDEGTRVDRINFSQPYVWHTLHYIVSYVHSHSLFHIYVVLHVVARSPGGGVGVLVVSEPSS